jgi:hypothetical protein
MIKKYCTHSMKLLFDVEVDGKKVKIFFNSKDPERRLSLFQTADEKIQKAIESTPHFGQYYWIDTRFEDISEPIVPKSLEEKTFSTINEAKDFLVNELKVDRKKIPNFTSIINRGKEMGYDIKFETKEN